MLNSRNYTPLFKFSTIPAISGRRLPRWPDGELRIFQGRDVDGSKNCDPTRDTIEKSQPDPDPPQPDPTRPRSTPTRPDPDPVSTLNSNIAKNRIFFSNYHLFIQKQLRKFLMHNSNANFGILTFLTIVYSAGQINAHNAIFGWLTWLVYPLTMYKSE